MRQIVRGSIAVLTAACLFPTAASAATGAIDGAGLNVLWAAPFALMLLSIAILPLAAPDLWHHHYGKVALGWGLAFVIPAFAFLGGRATGDALLEVVLHEYVPFMILITALFSIAGHIHIRGNLHGSPVLNTGFLAVGTACASIMGTTGAAMLFIRPLIRANDDRVHNTHVVIFFIFLVANIGGALTPLGDPPLFLGFLHGVEFFWTAKFLMAPTLTAVVILLGLFFVLDLYLYRKEGRIAPDPTPDSRISIDGGVNFFLLAGVMAAVLMSGSVDLGSVTFLSVELQIQNLLRDAILLGLAGLSFLITHQDTREANDFSFEPVIEVAKLFAAIFVTIIPVIAILKAGQNGALGGMIGLVTRPDGAANNAVYFWLTGGLSSFLDNAPTYLVFFNAAGADPKALMGPLATTLMAISAGAVYMGANTYIGNAPNFLVRSIAQGQGVPMPSFFGYMLWSGAILVPLFVLLDFLFFR